MKRVQVRSPMAVVEHKKKNLRKLIMILEGKNLKRTNPEIVV